MIFVDTNVIMYAVGGSHPLKGKARAFFSDLVSGREGKACASAEVLQELMHAYLPVHREHTLRAAFELVEGCITDIWSVEPADVFLARELSGRYPALGARDLIHLACCRRRSVRRMITFDRGLAAAFNKG